MALTDHREEHGDFIEWVFADQGILRFVRDRVLDEAYERLRREVLSRVVYGGLITRRP